MGVWRNVLAKQLCQTPGPVETVLNSLGKIRKHPS